MQLILSYFFAIYFFFMAAIFFPMIAVLTFLSPLVDPQKRFATRLTAAYLYLVCSANRGWKFSYQGLQHLGNGPYIIVCNHQSYADIVLLSALTHTFRWVSKSAVFQVPFVGWIMKLNGEICLKNGHLGSTLRMIRKAKTCLRNNLSVAIFPEGSRSPDGQLQPFKDGPFRLALDCNATILPVIIDGTHEVWPKHGRLKFTGNMKLKVLTPIMVAHFQDATELRRHVHALMDSELKRLRSAAPPPRPVAAKSS